MLYLSAEHPIVKDQILKQLNDESKSCINTSTIADYDGTLYNLQLGKASAGAETPDQNWITLSVSTNVFPDVEKACGKDFMKEIYGDHVGPTQEGYNATLEIDTTTIKEDDYESFSQNVAQIMRNITGHVLKQQLEGLLNKSNSGEVLTLAYRTDETMYIKSDSDRTTVIFALNFTDASDKAILRIFLEEFEHIRKMDTTLGDTPVCKFTPEPPTELKSTKLRNQNVEGYVSITVYERHAKKMDNTITLLYNFRNFLHYHIKCSKGYMHTRMRTQVGSWLQILNRAKIDDPHKKKEKKTASGKTFNRKF